MNARIAAVLDIRAVDDRQDVLFGHAGSKLLLQSFTGQIREVAASSEIAQLFLASDSPDSAEGRAKLDEFHFGEQPLELRDVTVGHAAHAHESDPSLRQSPAMHFLSQGWDRYRAV